MNQDLKQLDLTYFMCILKHTYDYHITYPYNTGILPTHCLKHSRGRWTWRLVYQLGRTDYITDSYEAGGSAGLPGPQNLTVKCRS